MNQLSKHASREPSRRKRVPPPASHAFDQLSKDLDGLERLQVMQLRLIQEIRKQLAELVPREPT